VPQLPTGTLTFLFTDIEGSTRRWEQHAAAMRDAVARHDEILRRAIESNGGVVFKTGGDAFYAVFPSATDAVRAAVVGQMGIESTNWGEIGPLRVRMALHTGTADLRENDYFGPPLNRVSRLLSIGFGGQVLLSGTTASLVGETLPPGAALKDQGEHRLRDLSGSLHVFQLLHLSLPSNFPALKSLDTVPNNLPTQVTSFVGREREVARVKELLATSRLLTLTGVGGSGKSRLSVQAAAELLEQYVDGVWFVELAPLAQPDLVPQILAAVLGIHAEPNQPILSTLLAALGPKKILVVLDNCEHLVDACARLADELIRGCAKISILASSREALQIAGETTLRVPPLASADPDHLPPLEQLAQYEAVQLFVERASAVQPAFALTPQNVRAVAQICHQLDGIPLAIELAAARVKVLSPDQIATRLNDRFKLLIGGSRTALPRQQTLRALVDWSYELLSKSEKALLRRLAIFAGGWTLEAAEAVCAGDELESDQILDLMTALVEKSLVLAEDQGDHVRYRLLETLRQYGREKLTPAEEQLIASRHARYCLDFLEGFAGQYFGTRIDDLDSFDAEYDNLRAAMAWAAGAATPQDQSLGACIAVHLGYLWYVRGAFDEGLRWLASATADGITGVEAHAINVRGITFPATGEYIQALGFHWSARIAWSFSEYRAAQMYMTDALKLPVVVQDDTLAAMLNITQSSIAVRAGNLEAIPALLNHAQRAFEGTAYANIVALDWGHYALARGNLEEAMAFYDRCIKLSRDAGDLRYTAAGLYNLGRVHMSAGQQDRAKALFEESLPILRKVGDWRNSTEALSMIGIIVLGQGDRVNATAYLTESLRMRANIGDRRGICQSLEAFATVAMAEPADPPRAARLLAAAAALREAIGAPFGARERAHFDELIADARAVLSPREFTECWTAGTALRLDETLALAFAGTTPSSALVIRS
jgi:predicted ATPase/class 3 adenylate cyclase